MGILNIKACPICGQATTRQVADLGKSAGEEGHNFLIYQACPNHGQVVPVEKPAPCHVCGAESTRGIPGTEIVPGHGDYIPGLPSVVALCDNAGCHASLISEANQKLADLYPEPRRGDYVAVEYTATPACNGRIYRLQCLCGKLPDGIIYRAEVGDCTYYRCDCCLPGVIK